MAAVKSFKAIFNRSKPLPSPPASPTPTRSAMPSQNSSGSSGSSSRGSSIFTTIFPSTWRRSSGSSNDSSSQEDNRPARMVLRDIENTRLELTDDERAEYIAMCQEAYEPYRPSSPIEFAPVDVEDDFDDSIPKKLSYSMPRYNAPFLVPPYKRLRRIARNTLGETVVVEHMDLTWNLLNTGELYCLKVFNRRSLTQPKHRKIILKELNAYKRLSEKEDAVYGVPLLLQLFGSFEDKESDSFFFVFPLLQCDFSVVIQNHVMSVRHNKRRWLAQIATGIHALHECGIIHRDIKPANILLDNQGNAVISDFGLSYISSGSRPLRPHYEYITGYMGTWPYMAPEVLKCRYYHSGFGVEVDWWALGCIAWEMEDAFRKPLFSRKEDLRIFCQDQAEDGGYKILRKKGISKPAALMIGGLLHPDPLKRSGYENLVCDPYFLNEKGYSEFKDVVERATSRKFKAVPGNLRNRTVATNHPHVYVPVVRPTYGVADEMSMDNYCWINPTGYWGEKRSW